MRQFAPIRTCGADHRVRADRRAARRSARRGWTIADSGSIAVSIGDEAEQQLGFGHDLIADDRRRLRARERRPPRGRA